MSAYPYSTAKQENYPKLASVAFKDSSHHAIIAKAGTLSSANYFEELFAIEAAKRVPTAAIEIAETATHAMKQVRSQVMSVFLESPPWTDDSRMQRMRDYNCEVMLAYFFDDIPYIYLITLDACYPDKQKQPFAATGCAANVAASVLSGFNFEAMSGVQACGLAVYTIEECKRNDSACGGDVQLGIIGKYPQIAPYFYDRDVIGDYEKAAAVTRRENRTSLTEKLLTNFTDDRIKNNKVKWLTADGKPPPEFRQPPEDPENPSSEPHRPTPTPDPQFPPP